MVRGAAKSAGYLRLTVLGRMTEFPAVTTTGLDWQSQSTNDDCEGEITAIKADFGYADRMSTVRRARKNIASNLKHGEVLKAQLDVSNGIRTLRPFTIKVEIRRDENSAQG